MFRLDYYKGKNPVLLIHTPSRTHASFQKFSENWNQYEAQAQELGLVVFELYGQDEGQIRGDRSLNAAEVHDLYDQYTPSPNNVTTIAIDKEEGSVVLKESGEVDLEKVFDLLDE